MSTNFIYYFVYGSNLLLDRFSYYIKGGIYPETGKDYEGCNDKDYHFDPNTPIKHITKRLNLYFGNNSNPWDDMGVAFVEEAQAEEGRVIGRLYGVTEEQFHKIQEQEGNSKKWYGKIIKDDVLGFYNGIPIWTITQDSAYKDLSKPSKRYLDIIKKGLKESGYSETKTDDYLNLIQ